MYYNQQPEWLSSLLFPFRILKFIWIQIVFLMWAINGGDIYKLIESDAGNALILIRYVGGDNLMKKAAKIQIKQLFLDWKLLQPWCLNTKNIHPGV